jgi:uncharacterized membrane protein
MTSILSLVHHVVVTFCSTLSGISSNRIFALPVQFLLQSYSQAQFVGILCTFFILQYINLFSSYNLLHNLSTYLLLCGYTEFMIS